MSTSKINRRVYNTDRFSQLYDTNGVPQGAVIPSLTNVIVNDSITYGDNVGHWRKKIALHESATSSLQGQKRWALPGYQDASQTRKFSGNKLFARSWGNLLDNGMAFNTTPTISVDPAADNIARSKLLQHYIAIRNTWRGGNFLAEIRETMHMLRHPLESFYHRSWSYVGSLGKLRKVMTRDPLDVSKFLHDAWLAYAFGVRPLVADVQDASKLLKEQLGSVYGADTTPISGKGWRETVSTTPDFPVSVPNISNTFCTQTTKLRFAVKYYGAVKARPPGIANDLEQSGLSPYDIVPAIWEATHFSFLVDYFVNVQEVLDSMRYWSAELAWLNRGVRNNSTVTRSNPYATNDASFTRTFSGGPSIRANTFVDRVGVGSMPYPQWQFKIPGFPSLKWMNMQALLVQHKAAFKGIL